MSVAPLDFSPPRPLSCAEAPAAAASGTPRARIGVLIPAYNEARSIKLVLAEIPAGLVQEVVVVDNASTDNTAAAARAGGATVVTENRPGYGSACLAGLAYYAAQAAGQAPEILVFLDGDHSDYPEQMPALLAPILRGEADMVIGSRALGQREKGALLPQQRFGNWLATRLLRLRYGGTHTDLGPFRAIRSEALRQLGMADTTYGWTVEMQVKAARQGLAVVEVPVSYRRRIGTSKVSGTVKGTLGAGYKILWTIFKYW
ncbi:glycosyl transferase family 2 [Hymenobacter roseosalivarius DSM 11622]|uniref:Glycosyl transferase family 2 n=1 Tax=Hymenobacter roseosalivarius DSM 11622 TaxID=645990 RepID=A0A1W1UKA3_9BACT|nr:glycosyltransferase family 2 protein [Hymenobacter roseosalivarius]SMB81221.1 glycosyl transferase family 2 [Hymenobacter roseosalivarius DSM 11622]